jgi:hypothetical protein
MTKMCTRRLDRLFDTFMKRKVVVFNQNTIKESHAVIHSASAGYGVFIENAQAGHRFSGIDDTRSRALDAIDKLMGQRRNPTHALQEIQ